MAIVEADLYANLYVETSPVQATASWTNHIASVRDISLSRGGRESFIGYSDVEVGSGTITLLNNNATIEPGYWVRVRYNSTNVWAGYVQDVNTSYRFIEGTEYVIKTLVVVDWVGWISQYSFDSYAETDTFWQTRLAALNTQIYPGGGNLPIQYASYPGPGWKWSAITGQTSVAEVLDLLANSTTGAYWKSNVTSPTGSTTGIDDLVKFAVAGQGYTNVGTFTDGTHTGTPSPLIQYTDVEMAKQTSSVINNVIVRNRFEIEGQQFVSEFQRSDSTSIATYGSRLATIDTNYVQSVSTNLFPYPSFEDYDYEFSDANYLYTIEKPSLDTSGSWAAYNGEYAARGYVKVAQLTIAVPPDERVEVTPGVTYYGNGWGGNSATASSRGRFFIQYIADDQSIISTTYGSYVNYTNNRQWYFMSTSALAPANAAYARFGIQHSRSTGTNFPVGSRSWTDGVYFGPQNLTYFDGNTPTTTAWYYGWYGAENASPSFRMPNQSDTIGDEFLNDNKTPKYAPIQVRINAQANLTIASTVDLYNTIDVWRGGNKWTSVVTGINHSITINENGTTRWVMDLILRPSTATI